MKRYLTFALALLAFTIKTYGSGPVPSFNPKDGKPLGGQALWYTSVDENNHCKEYIKLNPGSKPVLFYEHDRSIVPILGHHQRYLLINDAFAVGGVNVYVMDLKNLRKWRIDEVVFFQHDQLYSELVHKLKIKPFATLGKHQNAYDAGLLFIVEGKSFSPDDDQALLKIDYGPVMSSDENPHPEKYIKEWSYVVDVKRGGKILKVYQTSKVPDHWWIEPQ